MLTTLGRTLCATTTIGVRRAALTVWGMVFCAGRAGWDSAAGLQLRIRKAKRAVVRNFIATDSTFEALRGSRVRSAVRASQSHLQPHGRAREGAAVGARGRRASSGPR